MLFTLSPILSSPLLFCSLGVGCSHPTLHPDHCWAQVRDMVHGGAPPLTGQSQEHTHRLCRRCASTTPVSVLLLLLLPLSSISPVFLYAPSSALRSLSLSSVPHTVIISTVCAAAAVHSYHLIAYHLISYYLISHDMRHDHSSAFSVVVVCFFLPHPLSPLSHKTLQTSLRTSLIPSLLIRPFPSLPFPSFIQEMWRRMRIRMCE